jgi:hypothetical protein
MATDRPVGARWLGTALPLLALAAMGAWMVSVAVSEGMADGIAMPARVATQDWAAGTAQPPARQPWEATLATLQRALQWQPRQPENLEATANLLMVGAQQPWASPAEAQAWRAQAQQHYRTALQLRPKDALLHALLASSLAAAGQLGPDFVATAERAIALGPNEGYVHQVMLPLVLSRWDAASPTLQGWAKDLFERGTEPQRAEVNRVALTFGLQFQSDTPPQTPARR